jgi:hypothetical protein
MLPAMPSTKSIVRTAATAGLTEAMKKVPGASTAMTVVQEVFNRRAEARAAELLRAIAVHSGSMDWEEAAATLGRHAGEDWFDEAIEAGFVELMGATDSEVRTCLGALVAEYVINRKRPDVRFRRVGALFRDADSSMLPTLATIATMHREVLQGASASLRVLIRGSRRPDVPNEYWIGAGQHGSPEMLFSARCAALTNLSECTRALVGAGLGHAWAGLSSSHFQGDPLIYFRPEEDEALSLLDTCLCVWAQSRGAPSNP